MQHISVDLSEGFGANWWHSEAVKISLEFARF